VRDHFAILKVGPALTFALREALWGLDAIEREWIGEKAASHFRQVAIARMKAEPKYWAKYYHAQGAALDYDLQYSLSDRIRYYWPDAEIARAQSAMFRNLTQNPPPPALISQYLPVAYAAMREGAIAAAPAELAMANVGAVLDQYGAATEPARENAYA
jgi:D-tagatose-1,6-bisphosphate aldolase subunit GatZ/KbaZ